jgi:hypothetical protein
MPREINYLAFSTEELSAALAGFRCSQGNPFPGDMVERLTIRKTETSFQVTARIKITRSGKVILVMVEPHEVLSALILFCKSVGIPLALKAHKALDVIGDQVAMLTTVNFSYNRPEEKNGVIVYTDDELEANKASLQVQ